MDWFVAIVVYRSSSDAPGYASLYEETVLVLQAESLEAARVRAHSSAATRRATFRNVAGDRITWALLRVVDVAPMLEPPADGAELYARHFRDYLAYERFNRPEL